MKKRFICAIASFALLFMSAANLSAAWKPGLYGGFVSGGGNRSGYPAVSNVCNGPFAATNYVSGSSGSDTYPPIWASSRTWVYWGEVYLEKGKTCFAAKIDDWTCLKIDGKVYIDEATWYTVDRSGLLDLETGWHAFEVRFGNNGGGAGPDAGIPVGFGIRNDGVDSDNISDYAYPVDPMKGLPVLFRHDDGLARTGLLAINGEPKEYGEAVPAYGVVEGLVPGQEVACSVPPEVELAPGGKAYPLGWRLYDVEPETGAKTFASSGSGHETTYTSGEKDGELVWQWAISNRVTVVASEGGTISSESLWLADGASLPLVATAAEGYTFLRWTGDVPGTDLLSASISLTVDRPMTISALFAPATASGTKTWTGAGDGLRWEDGANWEPAGVPTLADAVEIPSGAPRAETTVLAHSIHVAPQGALLFAAKEVEGKEPKAMSLFPGEREDYGFSVAGDVNCEGQLLLGGRAMAGKNAFVVGGDFLLARGAKALVYPVGIETVSLELLRARYTPFAIGGALSVAQGATLYVNSDYKSGAHLRFTMETATIDGTVDSDRRGWEYFPQAEYIADSGAVIVHEWKGTNFFTYAPGPGKGIAAGGGHGGTGDSDNPDNLKTYGHSYGNPYAPCLAGSPSGLFSDLCVAGGGAIRMETRGLFTVNGTITSCGGSQSVYTSSAGGSIWIAAHTFKKGPAAILIARGGNSSTRYTGGGGRIAIAERLEAAELASLEAGVIPDGVMSSDYSDEVDVRGGQGPRQDGIDKYAPSGSAWYLSSADAFTSFQISTEPAGIDVLAPTPGWGLHSMDAGIPVTLTTPLVATDPAQADRLRYTCTGYTISDGEKVVLSGTTNVVTIADPRGSYLVTWSYAKKECKEVFGPFAGGSVSVAGADPVPEATFWAVPGAALPAIEAIPDEGNEFLFWTGDVPAGLAKANPLRLTADRPRDLRPVFRKAEPPTVRTWNWGYRGDWLDPTKWEPKGNIPGFEDAVVVPAGHCFAPNHIECASLTIKGKGIVRLASKADPNRVMGSVADMLCYAGSPDGLEEISLLVAGDVLISEAGQLGIGYPHQPWQVRVAIGGDLRLAGAGEGVVRLAPWAGAVSETTHDHATGAPFTVGGIFEIGPGATFYPGSHSYSGGSFAIRARDFRLLEGGVVDGEGRGYGYDEKGVFCIAPGRGKINQIAGAGYGSASSGNAKDSGLVYGQEMAPVEPGSPNSGYCNCTYLRVGAGLLRVHGERMTIAGAIELDGYGHGFGGSSGGGVWLTARWIDFGPKAVFHAAGGPGSDYVFSHAGGGRIAIERGLSDEAIDHLARTGELPAGMEKRVQRAEAFLADHPTATIDLSRGDKAEGGDGTFVYLNAIPQGTMLLLR